MAELAAKEKELGNAAYKKREFEKALEHYAKARELDPTDMRFLLNMAAVYKEQGELEKCAATALEAVELGRENRADYKLIAKAFSRCALAYKEMEKFEEAKTYYEKSLAEHRTPETRTNLSEVEKIVKEIRDKAYRDPKIAEEERERGNMLFREGFYPQAVQAYTESIKRNPDDPRAYSNRAACYNKLAAFDLGVRDCDMCIKLDSKFVKGYVRKGFLLKAMQQYERAVECFTKAIELDDQNDEAIRGYSEAMMGVDDDPAAMRRRAMADPDVQAIMSDPGMREILNQMREDPAAGREHMKNAAVAAKVQKLVQSGILVFR